jgi:putative ABC transport system ATP-binding protein
MNHVVECNEVSRVYDQDSVPVTALDGVDLTISKGEFVALVGPSGSGKSTLLNIIGGLDLFDGGSVKIDGVQLEGKSTRELSDLRLTKIGFVFQAYNLVPVLSARENVEFILQLQGIAEKEREDRAAVALESLGLTDMADRRPGELSGGQQQRVAIARAIVTRPALLVADEPTANLDSVTTRDLMALMQKLNKEDGVTIVIATHDPIVMEYASRQVNLLDGKIIEDS